MRLCSEWSDVGSLDVSWSCFYESWAWSHLSGIIEDYLFSQQTWDQLHVTNCLWAKTANKEESKSEGREIKDDTEWIRALRHLLSHCVQPVYASVAMVTAHAHSVTVAVQSPVCTATFRNTYSLMLTKSRHGDDTRIWSVESAEVFKGTVPLLRPQ